MGKKADIYYKVHPFQIIEEGFEPEYAEVSESIFSIANEYMGVRGYFEEGYSGKHLIGSYFNGIYEKKDQGGEGYKGIVHTTEYMVNAVDWLYVRVNAGGECLDLAHSQIEEFVRTLDLKTGLLKRSFVWVLTSGEKIRICFERLVSMEKVLLGGQRITFTSLDYDGEITLEIGLDFSNPHLSDGGNRWQITGEENQAGELFLAGKTQTTDFALYSTCKYETDGFSSVLDTVPDSLEKREEKQTDKKTVRTLKLGIKPGVCGVLERLVCNQAYGSYREQPEEAERKKQVQVALQESTFEKLLEENGEWWSQVWESADIVIEGDEKNQQGIRFCIFQLFQTFHGALKGANIGAKGLTGEAYNGNAFWDTETYCLPFYLFQNQEAAKNLLYFRYATLEEAKKRAADLDCRGAFYPIATISGKECCNLWQHASLQLQASTAVAYGIWIYEKLTGDEEFLEQAGLEMLLEISRMLASRGDFNSDHTRYGYYCVMGPDEFQMMVNHNCYTNYMGKFTLEYTLKVMEQMEQNSPEKLRTVLQKVKFQPEERELFQEIIDCMYIPKDKTTGIYEQHQGYFDLPHVEVSEIPMEDFPLYSHWSYDRIYRNDMIKQPDVLMFMLLFNSQFSLEELRANYEYYEPRCIHESSLSPSVHSILACQLGKMQQASDFFAFATRMDLDNYNRNTAEGLHTTSIAAAWMNIVFGFGGLRCDGDELLLAPSIPQGWKGYSFRIVYGGDVIVVKINQNKVQLSTLHGSRLSIRLYGEEVALSGEIMETAMK